MSALSVVARPTDGEPDDRELVARVRAGDERAFELLFQRYQPRIAAYVRGMVHDHGRAEDITQEVFMSALRRMREETERDILFKPWIFEIAKNKCIDAFRRARNASEVSFDAGDAIGADEHGRLAEPGATPDSAVEGKVAIDNLCGAFGGLSPVHHDILVLRELEGLSYREIGERLDMSRAAVESTLFRARRRLSEEYEELVSGERCLQVQQIVDASGGGPAGLRDRRRMARHLAHCQPCRRYAGRAGLDLGRAGRRTAAAARIAAFVPLPAFLRRRGGGDDAPALLGHGGSVGQWSANVASIVDPGVVSGWTKAVATAATVAVAGMGAGAAFTDRAPVGASAKPAAAVTHAAPWRIFAGEDDSPARTASRSTSQVARPAQRVRIVRSAKPRALAARAAGRGLAASPRPPVASSPTDGRQPGRPLDAAPSQRQAPARVTAALTGSGAGTADLGGAVGRVLDAVGALRRDAGGGARRASADAGRVLHGITAPVSRAATRIDATVDAAVERAGAATGRAR
jgi:RNA polymerase sigma factor (sigma-70 family)